MEVWRAEVLRACRVETLYRGTEVEILRAWAEGCGWTLEGAMDVRQ